MILSLPWQSVQCGHCTNDIEGVPGEYVPFGEAVDWLMMLRPDSHPADSWPFEESLLGVTGCCGFEVKR